MEATAAKRDLLISMVTREPDRLAARIRRIIRDEFTAEDLAQDALLRALRGLQRLRGEAGEASLCSWLDRIARNVAYNHVRDQGRRPASTPLYMEASDGAALDPAEACSLAEARTQLYGLIRTLPDGVRQVFLLREVEGLSTAEAAGALAISEGLVKWRLHRARQLLRAALV